MGCKDFLDREPLSQVTPEAYLNEESQLAAYANKLYPDILPSFSSGEIGFSSDAHTDIAAYKGYDNRYAPGEWKVPHEGGNWEFTKIYSANYFMERVLPLWEAGEITGIKENIDHYIGEMYFLRALEYYKNVQEFGDFPIVKTVLKDEKGQLIEASKRFPRNEVARFILSDLDQAILLLQERAPDGQKNRISKASAQLIKSRVALFEGTWLKYFKNTPFVPNGTGWPGKDKDYNRSYQYPSGSIDNEIDYFLSQSMEAAMAVADNYPLVENNGVLQQDVTDAVNPYHDMFGSENMSAYSEVLLWRQYDKGLGITHDIVQRAQLGNGEVGLTRGYVNSFLMANGLPIYAQASGYAGDDVLADVRKNRDGRLWLFLKEPGQKNVLYESSEGTHSTLIEPIPDITESSQGWGYTTGYTVRKFNNYDQKHGGNGLAYTGSLAFRSVEAYLNYIEACYEKNKSLDGKAENYWKSIRRRARVNEDFQTTIAATNMSEEAKNNWAAYSAGQLVDATLYNIRRERGCELLYEGFRYADLRRWRSMDQLMTNSYHIEGFKLWGPMQTWYNKPAGGTKLIYGLNDPAANVSSPQTSKYLRPYEISAKSLVLGGYKWNMAHYLSPIAIQHFLISSENNEVSTSPIYQNPGWPTTANQGPSTL
ncbi:RagB/SusD family nutrient uptake outer membrane protein [Olivibacter ginsenosidimutans]|uniref:RagB/SusD family nutrient uptake outer membrane protein n=2 Tax=Olivibacter ginsenosidimutans TaxID=1176537 RepID=A0ABP9BHQ5_9SPHI